MRFNGNTVMKRVRLLSAWEVIKVAGLVNQKVNARDGFYEGAWIQSVVAE